MGDYIGALVKRFESGTKGSLSLSSCGNDWGLSCGSYQLTLRWGNCINFLKKYFPDRARSLYFNKKPDIATKTWPGTAYCSSPDEVKAVWMDCYNAVGADKFFQYEHEQIQAGYYEPLMKKLGSMFNPNNHSRAMQECMWSWAVHRGSGGAYNEFCAVVNAAGIEPQATPAETLIDILYDKRFQVASYTRYQRGAGASSERETLRPYCNVAPLPYAGTNPSTGVVDGVLTEEKQSTALPWYRIGTGWQNGKCVGQVGAYHDLELAKKNCKAGQNIYDEKGSIIYSVSTGGTVDTFTPYIVKITASSLNVRKDAGTSYPVVMSVKRNERYTIVGEKQVGTTKWGKLKSGVGWISLSFATKV